MGLTAERKRRVRELVQSTLALPFPASACIAVEYAHGPGGDVLFKEVEQAVAAEVCGGTDAHAAAHVLPVMNWGITTSLNACVQHADRLGACYTAFCSLEVSFDARSISVLLSECDLGGTLVAGAYLPGHEFHGDGDSVVVVDASGRTTPWNTLAVWNTAKLAMIGFVHIANGSNVLNIDAGIEEVSTASVIQGVARAAGLPVPHVKLVKMPHDVHVTWHNTFGDTTERQEKHSKKMKNKNTRAQAHMLALGTQPARITHVVRGA